MLLIIKLSSAIWGSFRQPRDSWVPSVLDIIILQFQYTDTVIPESFIRGFENHSRDGMLYRFASVISLSFFFFYVVVIKNTRPGPIKQYICNFYINDGIIGVRPPPRSLSRARPKLVSTPPKTTPWRSARRCLSFPPPRLPSTSCRRQSQSRRRYRSTRRGKG